MKRLLLGALILMAFPGPARVQFVVVDHGNLAQAVLIAERTLREYEALMAQYQTLLRMSQGLGNLERYRMPTIHGAEHDVQRWEYGRSWLQGLNTGDPNGAAYRASARRLEPPAHMLNQLPPSARRTAEQAYATVEIADAIAAAGGHQVAL